MEHGPRKVGKLSLAVIDIRLTQVVAVREREREDVCKGLCVDGAKAWQREREESFRRKEKLLQRNTLGSLKSY